MAHFGHNEATQRLRDNQYRGGRGYTRRYYTVQDIARVTNRAVGTIRNDSSAGKVDLDDLESVLRYYMLWLGDDNFPSTAVPPAKRRDIR